MPQKSNLFLKRAWDVIFLFMYPLIVAFSLIFVSVLFIFSSISQLLAKLFPRKKQQNYGRTS